MSRRVKIGVTANTPLTNKQARFVEEYVKDFNGTQAAVRSGYSKKSARFVGCENLTKPNIAAAITAIKAKSTARNQIDAKYVLDKAHELYDRCAQPGKFFYPNAAARALELIGKHVDVNAFMRDEQHLHVHLNGLQERLGSARLRIVEKPSTAGLLDTSDDIEKAG